MTDVLAVTPDNFVRAESDVYFSGIVQDGQRLRIHLLKG